MISQEKWKILTPLQKLPKMCGNLGKIIVVTGFEKLPKVQLIAQSGHTVHGREWNIEIEVSWSFLFEKGNFSSSILQSIEDASNSNNRERGLQGSDALFKAAKGSSSNDAYKAFSQSKAGWLAKAI